MIKKPYYFLIVTCLCAIFGLASTSCSSLSQPYSLNTEKTKEFESNITVQELLTQMNLQLKSATLSDEPPGVLRKLKFTTENSQIIFYLKRNSSLFSDTRKWNDDLIKSAYVQKINVVDTTSIPEERSDEG